MDLCQARRRPQRILCVLSRARTKHVTNPAAKIVLFLSDNSISSNSQNSPREISAPEGCETVKESAAAFPDRAAGSSRGQGPPPIQKPAASKSLVKHGFSRTAFCVRPKCSAGKAQSKKSPKDFFDKLTLQSPIRGTEALQKRS